jgi:hypothetical protein
VPRVQRDGSLQPYPRISRPVSNSNDELKLQRNNNSNNNNSVGLVRERTILTERQPYVGEVSASCFR